MLVALLAAPSDETESIVKRTPLLSALGSALAEKPAGLSPVGNELLDSDVWPGWSLKISIELAVEDGRITAGSLLLGLIREPKSHYLD